MAVRPRGGHAVLPVEARDDGRYGRSIISGRLRPENLRAAATDNRRRPPHTTLDHPETQKALFELVRVYAFAVRPQRGVDEQSFETPPGGGVKVTAGVRDVIAKAFKKVAESALTTVDFDLDGSRRHEVRENVMMVAFGATTSPKAAAGRLAVRLSNTMDNRSNSALLLATVEERDPKRRVTLLVLPREDVVQLLGSGEEMLLDVLNDAFSTASGLRKIARVEGHDSKTQFLSADVLDFQLMSHQKSVADFWIRDFLGALPRVNSQAGSKALSMALQRAFEAASEDDRDAVFAAMFKASSGRVRKTSLEKFAEELPEGLAEAYFRGVTNPELRRTVFDVDRGVMKESLARRIITGADGVIISAPAETVGKSVDLRQKGNLRMVTYSGSVAKEKVTRGRRTKGEGPAV